MKSSHEALSANQRKFPRVPGSPRSSCEASRRGNAMQRSQKLLGGCVASPSHFPKRTIIWDYELSHNYLDNNIYIVSYIYSIIYIYMYIYIYIVSYVTQHSPIINFGTIFESITVYGITMY